MINVLRVGVSTSSFFLFICDAILIYISVIIAYCLRFSIGTDSNIFPIVFLEGIPVVISIILSIYYLDGYSGYFYTKRREFLFFLVILQSVILGYILLSIFYYIFPEFYLGRGIILLHFFLVTFTLYSWRLFFCWIFPRIELFNIKTVVIGDDNFAKKIYQELEIRNYAGFSIKKLEYKEGANNINDFLEKIWPMGIRHIIITPEILSKMPLEFLWQSHLFGYQILDGCTLYEWLTGKVPYEEMYPRDILFVYHPGNSYITKYIKRCMDIVLSIIGIILTLPFQIIIAALIKITSKGPILYTQERTGLYEKPFIIYKYRTMTTDAEKTGPQQASSNDPRVTKIGKYLRRTRFDELPQLFNILKGEMSLIGPRPERPHFTSQYKEKIPYYFLRHSVRPGLTGWAQVKHEYTNDFEGTCEKFRHDLYYIKYFSLGLDLIILIKTIKVVITGAGAK